MAARAVEREIVGREEERATIREFLAELDRLPSALVIEGEPGIGKTTLWRAGIAQAEDLGYLVLSAQPDQAESQVSYAGLRDLLDPLIEDALVQLPAPQRRALEIALLICDAENGFPDQAAIAFALLTVLRMVVDRPVLIAVDDVQWLDAPSAFALRFAARRLRAEPIGFLMAVRAAGANDVATWARGFLSEDRIRHVYVGPLSLGAIHRLLQALPALALARPTLQRVHDISRGNPFFALELARALQQYGADAPTGEPLPVPGELRDLLRARLAVLPPETEEPLRFAAAMTQPTLGAVAAALARDPFPALRVGVQAELIEVEGERIRFTHPLFASAVYAETDVGRRREIHRRLAAVVKDTEERARHFALAAEGADAHVASALDEAARSARSRGAPQAAAELSELALRLTPEHDGPSAHRRRLDAGAAHFEAGDTGRAIGLFSTAVDSAGSASERAAGLDRLAWVNHYAGDQRLAVELFRECLAEGSLDVALRVDAEEGLASSLFFLRDGLADALGHARSAVRLASKRGDRATHAVALGTQGMIEAVLGRPEAERTLQSAVAIEESTLSIPLIRRPSFQLAFARVWRDDLDAARTDLEGVWQRAQQYGDESSIPFILTYLGLAECLAGRLDRAWRLADEGEQVARTAGQEIGRAFVCSVRALAAAWLGRAEAARSDADEALALATRGSMFAEMTSRWALASLELARENAAEAHKHLAPLVEHAEAADVGEPGSIRFVTDDVEALVALGELEHARSSLSRYEEQARRLDRRTALAACARCQGLLAAAGGDFGGAETLFGAALELDAPHPLPLEHARTLLALGAVQRRGKRRRAARETLGQAKVLFDQLGASAWSERAQAELRRIGGRAPSPGELTPAEQRVAELVAEGRTNKEVAAALHLTERTVEGTLSRVYAKLGLRSRSELAHNWPLRR